MFLISFLNLTQHNVFKIDQIILKIVQFIVLHIKMFSDMEVTELIFKLMLV